MSTADVARIDARELPDDEVEERLVRALRARGGRATEADLVVDSGVPPHQVGPGMRKLLALYESDLDVTEDGHLVYRFAPGFERRDVVPWARTKRVGAALWRGFRAFYKVAISVVLVGYVALFALLTIAALVAVSSSRSDDRNDGGGRSRNSGWGGSSGGGGLFWLWNPFGTFLPWGGDGRGARARRLPARGDGKPFWKKVFAFVFGPEEPERDRLADERALLAFIRDKGGVVAPTELVARTGWSLDAADKESTKLLARYGGDVEVIEDGQMLYVFRDLLMTAGEAAGASAAPPSPVWERYETREALTGNSAAANVGIGAMNAFVLFASTVLVPQFIAPRLGLDVTNGLLQGALVIAPAVYGALFFLIPTLRAVGVMRRNGERAWRNVRRAVLRDAFAGKSPDGKSVADAVPKKALLPSRAPAALDPLVRQAATELGGDASTDGDALVWRFSRIAEEAQAVAARRRGGEAKLLRVGDEALAYTTR